MKRIIFLVVAALVLGLFAAPAANAQPIFPLQPDTAVATCGPSNPAAIVFGVVDIRDPICNAPPFAIGFNEGDPNNWFAPMYHNEMPNPTNNPADVWNVFNLGYVFGIALDDATNPNIYLTATSSFGVFPSTGRVVKINGTTGAISTLTFLPNTGPGLGNIAFHRGNKQLYVTNFEDGKIYRLNSTTVVPLSTFDPFGADDGSPGFAPLGERLWGIGINPADGRLYFSVWNQNVFSVTGTQPNQVYSIGLDSTGEFTGSPVLEITAPPLANQTSSPISDIAFSATGDMLLAERTMFSDISPTAHLARILSYTGSSGAWVPSGAQFGLGRLDAGFGRTNASGGVDWTDCVPADACNPGNLVAATVDAFDCCSAPNNIYGIQILPATGGNLLNSWGIDLDADTISQDKTQIGDVEIYRLCVPPPPGGGCTRTQGYWKTHNKYAKNASQNIPWPAPESEDTLLCGKTWLNILKTPPNGDAWYILVHQWIAAKLNVASGASTTPAVDACLASSETLLLGCSISPANRAAALACADTLDQYNNGLIGPGHCDDEEGGTGGSARAFQADAPPSGGPSPFLRKLFIEAFASISVPSTVNCSSESSRLQRASSTICPKKSATTSASNRRSRFFENAVASNTVPTPGKIQKPAEKKVVLQPLAEQPLRSHRVRPDQNLGLQKHLRRDRGPCPLRVEGRKRRLQPTKRLIGYLLDDPDRMDLRNQILRRHRHHQLRLLLNISTHESKEVSLDPCQPEKAAFFSSTSPAFGRPRGMKRGAV